MASIVTMESAAAQQRAATTTPEAPSASRLTYEASAGADGTGPSWSVYGGLTAALFGDLREDGFRLRASGGYGRYRYTRPYFDRAQRRFVWPEFFGAQTFTDLLVGYQATLGATTVKAYAGMTDERHSISAGPRSPIALDDENAVQGAKRGAKIMIETWTRLSDWGFLQVDANWSQSFEAYGSRLRLGHHLDRGWSVGLESAAFGNLNHDGGRVGAFLRYEWASGEVSASAGIDGDLDRIGAGYASIGALIRF